MFFFDKADEELLNQKIRSEIVTLDGRGEHPTTGAASVGVHLPFLPESWFFVKMGVYISNNCWFPFI